MKKTLIIEPFYTGSHRTWCDLLWSQFENVELLTMPGRHWKWRLNGAGIHLAEEFLKLGKSFDRIIATSFLDLTTFMAHAKIDQNKTEIYYYFHENQFSYPTSIFDFEKKIKRDKQYGFIQLNSALLADKIFFNSEFNKNSFINGAFSLMNQMPDFKLLNIVEKLNSKAEVLPVPHQFVEIDKYKVPKNDILTICWGHRLEWDKSPEFFVDFIRELCSTGENFQLYIHGDKNTDEFINAELAFAKDYITSHGFLDKEEYYKNLWKSHICFSSAIHEFQGIFMQEAIYCKAMPLAPKLVVYPEYIPDKFLYSDLKEALSKVSFYQSYKGELSEGIKNQFDFEILKEKYNNFIN